ncbi:MAG: trehalose-phosphatase [Aeromicrobium sp.]
MSRTTAEVEAVVADPSGTLLALDFDGTLAHVVDDPEMAFAHAHAVDALARLGPLLGQIAIITGRPVRQALELGGFVGRPGFESLVVCGQYGAERWDAATGETPEPDHPEAVRILADCLPQWLAERGADHVRVEDKGLAVAVHTRGLEDGLLDELAGPLEALAAEHGLTVEPGRQVVELRAPGPDKGEALERLAEEVAARHIVFAGDDLGDLPAFDAVDRLRSNGLGGLLVCSASDEQDALVARADLVLDGPDAVAVWLGGLADALDAGQAS